MVQRKSYGRPDIGDVVPTYTGVMRKACRPSRSAWGSATFQGLGRYDAMGRLVGGIARLGWTMAGQGSCLESKGKTKQGRRPPPRADWRQVATRASAGAW